MENKREELRLELEKLVYKTAEIRDQIFEIDNLKNKAFINKWVGVYLKRVEIVSDDLTYTFYSKIIRFDGYNPIMTKSFSFENNIIDSFNYLHNTYWLNVEELMHGFEDDPEDQISVIEEEEYYQAYKEFVEQLQELNAK